MTFKEYWCLVKSDLYRYTGGFSWRDFWYHLLVTPGFKLSFTMRTTTFLTGKKLLLPLFIVFKLLNRHWRIRYNVEMPPTMKIGAGIYIKYNSTGILGFNGRAEIGNNITLEPSSMVVQVNTGKYAGCAVIGDNVYLGARATIVGRVIIGNNVIIKSGALVVRDVPDNAIVEGAPARVIGYQDANNVYKHNVWEPECGEQQAKTATAAQTTNETIKG